MARTQILSANALTQKRWPQTFFECMLANMQISKFMGPSSDEVIQVNMELVNNPGDQIIFELDMPLAGAGGGDDSDIEGNEESMSFYNMSVYVHERNNGVRSAGKMTDKRSAIDIRAKATYALSRWAAEQVENDVIWSLSGLGNQGTYVGEGTSDIETVNEHAPSTNRVLYGGQTVAGVETWETSMSLIGDGGASDYANYYFGTKVISTAKRKAQLASPKFRPIRINGKAYYVMFIHPLQTKSLREETGTAGWVNIQSAANIRGINNPLFTRQGSGDDRMFDGAVGIYDDVIIYESERIVTRVAGESFEDPDTATNIVNTYIVDGTAAIARALLCGAQAGALAWGQTWRRYERKFDYNRKPGTAIDAIYGVSKTVFNDPGANQSTNTAQEDFAVIAVNTAVKED